MGLLDSLNPLSLAKNAIESVVDSVLPDGLKTAGADLVGVAIDLVSGDYVDLPGDVAHLLHDADQGLSLATDLPLPATTTEPDAPPPTDTDSGAAASSQQGAAASATTSPSSASTDATTAGADVPAATQPAAGADAAATTSGTTKSTGASSSSTSSSSTSKSSTTKSSTTKSSSSSSDSKTITKFFAQSDADLMAAVRDGKLPDAVKNDPASMQRLQLRVNEISEMNQLISQMMAAMHEMNKVVIQNIRA